MARKSYGVGYQGSKNRIAQKLMNILPSGNRFVDLFSGGCAMTHCAMLSGKYNEYLCNDLYPHAQNLFQQAITTGFDDPKYLRWISREDFFKYKDSDDFVRCCWSFGYNQNDYMYSTKIEPFKKALHYAIVFDQWDDFNRLCSEVCYSVKQSLDGIKNVQQRRQRVTKSIVGWLRENGTTEMIMNNTLYRSIKTRTPSKVKTPDNICELQSLPSLESISRLQTIQRFSEQIFFTNFYYKNYEYKDGDVVYCDPPYNGTGGYANNTFDHDAFYEWVRTRDYPIYFSEYSAPDDFVSVFNTNITKMMKGGKSAHNKATEHLFIHKKFFEKLSK